MKPLSLEKHLPGISRIACGCMGLGGPWDRSPIGVAHMQEANDLLDTALANGINFFDHADIYTLGKAEECFGKVLSQRKSLRDNIFIQSKCGIRLADKWGPKRYDLSFAWITQSVDGILKRLNTEYIDLLLLHRPDPLLVADEVARAFEVLHQSGKVRHFGVSNMQIHQVKALQRALDLPLVVNQIELHLNHTQWLDEDVYAGHPNARDHTYSPGLMAHCVEQEIQIQSWGSLSQGVFTGNATALKKLASHDKDAASRARRVSSLLDQLAINYGYEKESLLLAWLMRHPSNIQPVIGTINAARISACSKASEISLSAVDWYALYVTARAEELP